MWFSYSLCEVLWCREEEGFTNTLVNLFVGKCHNNLGLGEHNFWEKPFSCTYLSVCLNKLFILWLSSIDFFWITALEQVGYPHLRQCKAKRFQVIPKKLLDQVRDAIRVKHYARNTEQAYVYWIKKLILFHHKRHPEEMGAGEVQAFLTHL